MASLNQCQFIGNLGADPETRSFQNGGKVCNLRLAVSESWKDKATGEKKEKTEWVSVAIFGDGLATVAERYLRKGSKVFVSGKLSTRKWTDKDGGDRYSTEIVLQGPGAVLTMLDGPQQTGERKRGYDDAPDRRGPDGTNATGAWGSNSADLDDEIPF